MGNKSCYTCQFENVGMNQEPCRECLRKGDGVKWTHKTKEQTKWRPENWDDMPHLIDNEKELYEAGADAMLEAIWRMAKASPTGKFEFDSNTQNQYEVKS